MKISHSFITCSLVFLVSFKLFFAITNLQDLNHKTTSHFEKLIQAAELKSSIAIRFDGQLNKASHSFLSTFAINNSLDKWYLQKIGAFSFSPNNLISQNIILAIFIRAPTSSIFA